GLCAPGRDRGQVRTARTACLVRGGRGRLRDDGAGAFGCGRAPARRQDRAPQQPLSRHGAPVPGRLLRRRALPGRPDPHARFREAFRAYGMPALRVEKLEDIGLALDAAERTKGPFLIDFRIDPEANVYPIVPLGKGLGEFWEAPENA